MKTLNVARDEKVPGMEYISLQEGLKKHMHGGREVTFI